MFPDVSSMLGLLALARKVAERICRKSGLLPTSNSKPGRHLPFHHPSMLRVRTYVQQQIATGNVHGRLVSNFDQVWSLLYRPLKRTLQCRGEEVDPLARSLSLRKVRHCVERCLSRPFTESLVKSDEDCSAMVPEIQGKLAGSAPIEQYRLPHTLTTVSYADGYVSRGFVTARGDCLSESQRRKANEEPRFCSPSQICASAF